VRFPGPRDPRGPVPNPRSKESIVDTIILAMALVAFFGMVVSWLALPSSTTSPVTAHTVPATA